ncbi:universal stress protein [Candidatus Obscuribacterales bacterium]|nr:universal stress protein [Candidatus Obscuribacterales bacterium]
MSFENILVAIDGSKNSQIAAEYGFWIANKLDASVTGQHVVDPRLVDLFIEPEFAEELGMDVSVDTSERVCKALKKIGKVILDRFESEAKHRNFDVKVNLSEGYIVEEILRYSQQFDLLVVGHRGRGDRELPAHALLGSVAERIVLGSHLPVLIAVQPIDRIEEILVAFDGSEAAKGALLMAENFAKNVNLKLKAVVVSDDDTESGARAIAEQGEKCLREYWSQDVFSIQKGDVHQILLDRSESNNSLLVLGAYGFKSPAQNVLGRTTTSVIRQTQKSVLVYRPAHPAKAQKPTHSKAAAK